LVRVGRITACKDCSTTEPNPSSLLWYGMDGDFETSVETLFRRHGLEQPRLFWDPSPDEIPVDYLRELLLHWRGLRRGDELPHMNRIDPVEFRSMLPHINLLEVVDGGRDFRYRVFSTTLADRLDVEFTGRLISEAGMFSAPFFALTYRESMARRLPLLTVHAPPPQISVSEWTRLVLPLVDDANEVARFVTGVHAGRWRAPR